MNVISDVLKSCFRVECTLLNYNYEFIFFTLVCFSFQREKPFGAEVKVDIIVYEVQLKNSVHQSDKLLTRLNAQKCTGTSMEFAKYFMITLQIRLIIFVKFMEYPTKIICW